MGTNARQMEPARQRRSQKKERKREEEEEEDDERTMISKNISWILRHGARQAGVKQDPQTKWVKFSDLCEAKVLKDFTPEVIWQVILDFNNQKVRYEIDERGADGRYIRAYKREQKKESGASRDAGEKTVLRGDAPVFAPALSQSQQFPNVPGAMAAYQAQQAAWTVAAQQLGWPWNMGMNPMMPYMPPPFVWPQSTAAAAAAAPAETKFQGRIKSFSSEKGFGFIECRETYAQYSRDVFLHKAQIGDLAVGNFVQFSCEVNKQGMPQAKDLLSLGPSAVPMQQQATAASKGGGKGKGKDGGKDGGKGKSAGKAKGKGGKIGEKGKTGKIGEETDTKDKSIQPGAPPEGGDAEVSVPATAPATAPEPATTSDTPIQ